MSMKTERKERTKLVVSVSEAADMMGVSRPTMYKILNRSDCCADFKLGNRRLVSVDALRAWVAKQTEGGVQM